MKNEMYDEKGLLAGVSREIQRSRDLTYELTKVISMFNTALETVADRIVQVSVNEVKNSYTYGESKEEFVKKVEQAIDDYFIIHQSDNVPLKKKTKKEFVDMMINAYEMEQMSAPTVLKEEDNGCYHKKTGLIIHGLPDKVVKLGNKYWIIDYKTSRKLKHDPSDPKTMLQCVTYAYVLNKRFGYDIAGFEYWYLRYKKAIKSNDDGLSMDDYYQALDEVLDEIKTSYETGIFTPNLDKCDKCYFKKACPRKKK